MVNPPLSANRQRRDKIKASRSAPIPISRSTFPGANTRSQADESAPSTPRKRRGRRRGRRAGARSSRGLSAAGAPQTEEVIQPDSLSNSPSNDSLPDLPLHHVSAKAELGLGFFRSSCQSTVAHSSTQPPVPAQRKHFCASHEPQCLVEETTRTRGDHPTNIPVSAVGAQSPPPVREPFKPSRINDSPPAATDSLPKTLSPHSLVNSLPRAYNKQYPHPLTVYAAPSVNPASVAVSGYAPLLKNLLLSDPKAATGAIIAECNRKDLTAPALMLDRKSHDGCGIPEEYWLRLSSWAGVKVPLGVVVPLARSRGALAPRFLSNAPASSGPVTPPLSSSASTVALDNDRGLETPVSSTVVVSPVLGGKQLFQSRSEVNLRAQHLLQSRNHKIPGLGNTSRRGSLPNIRDEHTLQGQGSPMYNQATLGALSDAELMQELRTSAAAIGLSRMAVEQTLDRLTQSHKPFFQMDKPMAFQSLSTVDEAEGEFKPRSSGMSYETASQVCLASPTSPRAGENYGQANIGLSSIPQSRHSRSQTLWNESVSATCVSRHKPLQLHLPQTAAPATARKPTTRPLKLRSEPQHNHPYEFDSETRYLPAKAWDKPSSSTSFDFSAGKSIWS